jgi:HlyD family type I secretion membrane fusion protein
VKTALAKLERLKQEFTRMASGSLPVPAANGAIVLSNPVVIDGSGAAEAARLVRSGVIVLVGFIGLFGLWAAVSPIDSAAIAYGSVGADGNRKAVQHLDGGVVAQILVKEGDPVKAGQELIRLDQIQPRAALEIQSAAVETQSAVIARLESESAGSDKISFPPELLARTSDPSVKALLESQEQIFNTRRTSIAAQITTTEEQIKQSKSQTAIYKGQAETSERQYNMIQEELGPKQMLYNKGYATNSPVLTLKRAAAALEGQKQEYLGHIARLEYQVTQLEGQINQIRSDYNLKMAQELEDARNKLADAKERERVAKDILERTVIRASVGGTVLGLKVNTIGGVIGKGENLLEIVPSDAETIIKGRLKPTDGIEVQVGMAAELRILSAQGRRLPMVHGVVRKRSADAREDLTTRESYMEVDVALVAGEERMLGDVKLVPGTPVEIIIPTGERTVLDYFLEPLEMSLRHGMREH